MAEKARDGRTRAKSEQEPARPVFSTPPPEGVVEVTGVDISSLVELKDGSLLGISLDVNGRISTDGGRTWGEPRPLGEGVSGSGIMRLASGALALSGGGRVWLSRDEGKTWTLAGEAITKTSGIVGDPYSLSDEMIQLDSGRLVYPCYLSYTGKHPELTNSEGVESAS